MLPATRPATRICRLTNGMRLDCNLPMQSTAKRSAPRCRSSATNHHRTHTARRIPHIPQTPPEMQKYRTRSHPGRPRTPSTAPEPPAPSGRDLEHLRVVQREGLAERVREVARLEAHALHARRAVRVVHDLVRAHAGPVWRALERSNEFGPRGAVRLWLCLVRTCDNSPAIR